MTDHKEAALKAARTRAVCASHDIAVKYGGPEVGRLKDEIADLVLTQRREAKIKALEWAERHCWSNTECSDIKAKIARLREENV